MDIPLPSADIQWEGNSSSLFFTVLHWIVREEGRKEILSTNYPKMSSYSKNLHPIPLVGLMLSESLLRGTQAKTFSILYMENK